jgi:hypothetical protein
MKNRVKFHRISTSKKVPGIVIFFCHTKNTKFNIISCERIWVLCVSYPTWPQTWTPNPKRRHHVLCLLIFSSQNWNAAHFTVSVHCEQSGHVDATSGEKQLCSEGQPNQCNSWDVQCLSLINIQAVEPIARKDMDIVYTVRLTLIYYMKSIDF